MSRKTVVYDLDYSGSATPSKLEVKKFIAGTLKVKEGLIVLNNILPRFGNSGAKVVVDVYENEKALKSFSAVKKKKEEKKPAEAKAEEKPAEAKVEEKKEE